MRRLIILFMLCLLPVQISWAVVTDYAAHEPVGHGQHDVHHHDAHVVATAFDLDLSSHGTDSDQLKYGHDHCHLTGFIGLMTSIRLHVAVVPDSLYLQGASPAFTSQILDRPERPKWRLLA